MSKLVVSPMNATSERADVIRAGREMFDQVIAVNPHIIWAAFEDGGARVWHNGVEISDADMLITRIASNRGAASYVLAKALEMNGCNIVDPVSRFSVGKQSKLKTSIKRAERRCGPDTYVAFSLSAANDLLTYIRRKGDVLPIIIKPIDGKRSAGKIILNTAKSARPVVREFFASRTDADSPLFIQRFEDITHEYRVLAVNGVTIGVVRKDKKSPRTDGSDFVVVSDLTKAIVAQIVRDHCVSEGIVGVDIGLTRDRRVIVIEENRAPVWTRFQEVTGIDVAAELFDILGDQYV